MLEPLLSTLNSMRVILATSSKQRQDILKNTGLKFEIHPSDFAENLDRSKYTFSEYVEQTALHKVKDVHQKLKDEEPTADIIIGLDTMIHHDGQMFGKPKSKEDAVSIISRITGSGMPHFVITGVAIYYKEKITTFSDLTSVYMEKLSQEEVLSYVATGECIGKAGAYAIQGIGGTFVTGINGDYNNVVGIPICKLTKKLKELLLKN